MVVGCCWCLWCFQLLLIWLIILLMVVTSFGAVSGQMMGVGDSDVSSRHGQPHPAQKSTPYPPPLIEKGRYLHSISDGVEVLLVLAYYWDVNIYIDWSYFILISYCWDGGFSSVFPRFGCRRCMLMGPMVVGPMVVGCLPVYCWDLDDFYRRKDWPRRVLSMVLGRAFGCSRGCYCCAARWLLGGRCLFVCEVGMLVYHCMDE